MIGLLLKDLIYMRKQAKYMALLIVFYLVMFIQMKDTAGIISIISMVVVLLSTILVMNSFAYDELSKWDTYSLSLPVSKAEIVLCKYLLTAFLAGAGIAVSILVAFAKQLLNTEAWLGIYGAFAAAMVLAGILIPLLYKFGVQRARILILVIVMLPTAGYYLFQNLSLPMPAPETLDLFLRLSPLLLAAVIAASFFASCKIFQKKEL